MTETLPAEFPPVTELTKPQRRVLGVLVEKGLTTPDAYPLSLKATTTGCNQKSNRDPLTNYDESTTYDTLDQLREMGLVGFVHTESGRTERYRHYVRKRFTFSEPQIAIMAELMLRGRQTMGELRARASRMVPIDSLEQLRDEVGHLQEMNYVQSTGRLEQRGVEVDHNLYSQSEARRVERQAIEEGPAAAASPERQRAPAAAVASPSADSPPAQFEQSLVRLSDDNREFRDKLEALEAEVRRLNDEVTDLKQALGG